MLNGKHILAIDDSETMCAYLHDVLSPLGATVVSAASGQAGLEKCATDAYDLILLDLLLPDTDGIQVLGQIRAHNDSSTIVMLTSFGDIRSAITAVQQGADAYLQKQDITASEDHAEFFYALEQALKYRAGLIAQKQLEMVRADFYSMVTHDLRNLTTTILTATELLARSGLGSLTANQQDYVIAARTAADKLADLANKYLDFAQIDAGYLRLNREEVDLRQVVKTSARLAALQAQARQQSLDIDVPSEPLQAYADAERFAQVVDNLLSNAVKYTPEGGYIQVFLKEENHQAVLRVHDSGPGIPSNHLLSLFTKYHRVQDPATRSVHGLGLGLLIVKEIITAHGGRVYAESEGIIGRGSTFIVTIPLTPGEGDLTVPESLVPPAGVARPASTAWNPTGSFPKASPRGELEAFSQDPEFLKLFYEESKQHLQALQSTITRLYFDPGDRSLLEAAHHTSHTLKGNASAMQQMAIYALAAQMDSTLKQAIQGTLVLTQSNVRELVQQLEQIARLLADVT